MFFLSSGPSSGGAVRWRRVSSPILLTLLVLGTAPAHAALDPRGFNFLCPPDSTSCSIAPDGNSASSTLTTITLDSLVGNTITVSIQTELSAPDGPDLEAPIISLDFDTTGQTETIHFVENVTNTGTLAWHEWAQTAAPFHWNPSLYPFLLFGPVPAPPGSIKWANLTANVPGTADIFPLPEATYDDPLLGNVTLPEGTLTGAVYNFDSPLGQTQTAVFSKDLTFNLAPDTCDPFDTGCESGVVLVASSYFPAAVPIPPSFGLLAAGLAGLVLVGKRKAGNKLTANGPTAVTT